ncbi:MAG: C39 family peptidase, partial [Deltaproteobacteria bacterium]|nr:C39 family peptidase [Deltaproteobacteria bacterium]
MSTHRAAVVALLLTTLSGAAAGCASSGRDTGTAGPTAADAPAELPQSTDRATTADRYGTVLIEGVPHVEQKPDFCGEAAAEMALRHFGKPYHQDQVFALSGMPPARGMGATTRELRTALTGAGFEVGPVWHTVAANNASAELDQLFGQLHADLAAGVPSIVCMHYSDRPHTTEHFRLVLGYDGETGEVIYHEPAEPGGAYRRMDRAAFLKLWPLKYARDRWTVVRFALKPTQLRNPPKLPAHSPADFAQHVMALKKRLPEGFTIVVEPPFVVIGNDTAERVKRSATGTVRWAVTMLKQDYFRH